MKAYNVIMQLGTQSGTDGLIIPDADILRWQFQYLIAVLQKVNGGYFTDHGKATVKNHGYCEMVHIISFILPTAFSPELMPFVQAIRTDYREKFKQESVVTLITECEVLL
jgi:hypothetical protein